jgi:hypothetical protein
MATATEIITQALRESNVLPIGQEPNTAQRDEALPRLNNYIQGLFGTVLGEFIADWSVPPRQTAPKDSRYPLAPAPTKLPADVWPYPPQNVRLVASNTTETRIYLPRKPSDGARLGYVNIGQTADLIIDANGRYIQGGPTVTVPATATYQDWFYRADRGEWVLRANLALTDEQPFPEEFDDLLVTGLAIRLGPRFGKRPPPETAQTNALMRRRMKQRYKQHMPKPGTFDPRYYSRQAHGGEDTYIGDNRLYGDN